MPAQIGYFDTLKSTAGKILTFLSTITLTGTDGKTITCTQDISLDEAVAMSSKAPKASPAFTTNMTAQAASLSSGPELVTNGLVWTGAIGDATVPTGWTQITAGIYTATADAGPGGVGDTALTIARNAANNYPGIKQDITVVVGKYYLVCLSFKKGTSPNFWVGVGSTSGGFEYAYAEATPIVNATWNTQTFIIKATTTTLSITLRGGITVEGQTALFDNVSAKEIPATITDLFYGGIPLLSIAYINAAANADTTIFTVPVGKRCVLDHAIFIAGGDAGATTTISIGADGTETDFIPANTLSNLDAVNDAVILMPVPNTTPTKTKSYAAGTVIQAQIASQSGVTNNMLMLFGVLY